MTCSIFLKVLLEQIFLQKWLKYFPTTFFLLNVFGYTLGKKFRLPQIKVDSDLRKEQRSIKFSNSDAFYA